MVTKSDEMGYTSCYGKLSLKPYLVWSDDTVTIVSAVFFMKTGILLIKNRKLSFKLILLA